MKILILFLSILLLFSCRINKDVKTFESYDLTTPNFSLRYDTLEGDFLYEVFIEPYMVVDAFVKSKNFIKGSEVNEETYKKGYYVLNPSVLSRLKKNYFIRYDSLSVNKFYSEIYNSALILELVSNK